MLSACIYRMLGKKAKLNSHGLFDLGLERHLVEQREVTSSAPGTKSC